jgi:hypothetical protein
MDLNTDSGLSQDGMTLVLNPNARKMRLNSVSVEDFQSLLSPESDIHLTRDLEELDALMSNWKHGERTLCFFGGDGSISRGITSLIRQHGESFNLPPVLPVRAGTINMLCNVMGKREKAQKTLERWQSEREKLTIREVPTLRIQVEDEEPRYGFVFAWGIGHRVCNEYYSRTETPNAMDGAAVMTQAFLQAITPFNENLPLFKRENLRLRVEGAQAVDTPMHSLVAGTIPRLSLGIRPFPPGEILPGGFSFSANGMPLYKVAALSPSLLFGIGDQNALKSAGFANQLVCGRQVKELECELTDGFTLDGEIFDLPKRSRVRFAAGPVVRFWSRA